MHYPKTSPWGQVDNVEGLAPGILFVSTPSHGGIKLDRQRNAAMPATLRLPGGWYEEDCDYARVFLVFADEFPDKAAQAKSTVKNWAPDAYEAYTGEVIPEGESFIKDERLFQERHQNDYLVLAAWGDWHDKVPKGFTGVFAGKGGRTKEGHFPKDTKYFLVPKEEYNSKMVLDPSRHQEIPLLD